MSPRRKVDRDIRDIMRWSQRCREHFFPWRAKAGVPGSYDVAEAGITEAYPGYHLERSTPKFHLLVYTTDGTGHAFDAQRELRVQPGQVLIAPAGKAFGYFPEAGLWRFLWFHLPDDVHWESTRQMPLTVRKTVLTEPLHRCMEGLLVESRGTSESHAQVARLYIELIALYVRRQLSTEYRGEHAEQQSRADQLQALIQSDLARDWSVGALAAALTVSEPHLHRITKELFGLAPMKLVTRFRMERAQELLIMHDVPQRVIGEMVGYQDEFAFAVAFKRFSGVTPGAFRKRR